MQTVEAFLSGLDPETASLVEALREIVAGSHPGLSERIKWNAPSFAIGGDDRITLGIERSGGVRIVFHRGAKPRQAAGFRFDDPQGLANWPAPDRGVILFRDMASIDANKEALADLCRRWFGHTA